MATVVINGKALYDLLQSPAGPVAQDLRRRANNVRNTARRLAPVDNGTLKNSIAMQITSENGELVARVGSNLKYARFVHEGTGLYGPRKQVIRPVRAKALRWKVGAVTGQPGRASKRTTGYAFAKFVRGSKPNPFLRNALKAAER